MTQRRRVATRIAAGLVLMSLASAEAPVATLHLTIDKLRSKKGVVRLCLTADPKNFPGCLDDTNALTRSVPAGNGEISVEGLPHGDYAAAVIHDENSNKKLDTFMGIPKEGFGFSRNPAIHFAPPRFAAARFTVASDREQQNVTMRYLL